VPKIALVPKIAVISAVCAGAYLSPSLTYPEVATPNSTPVRIAVFDFELDDQSPTADYLGKTTSDAGAMEKVSKEARRALSESGRYKVIDVPKDDPRTRTPTPLRKCDGCEAHIALQLGADQSLMGVVSKVNETDYYVVIQIREASTGKLLDQQEANFVGSEEGWPSGVRMLIRHQLLLE